MSYKIGNSEKHIIYDICNKSDADCVSHHMVAMMACVLYSFWLVYYLQCLIGTFQFVSWIGKSWLI